MRSIASSRDGSPHFGPSQRKEDHSATTPTDDLGVLLMCCPETTDYMKKVLRGLTVFQTRPMHTTARTLARARPCGRARALARPRALARAPGAHPKSRLGGTDETPDIMHDMLAQQPLRPSQPVHRLGRLMWVTKLRSCMLAFFSMVNTTQQVIHRSNCHTPLETSLTQSWSGIVRKGGAH